jgi:hypothetical protein
METLTRLVVECMTRHGFPDGSVRTLFPAAPADLPSTLVDSMLELPPEEVVLAPPGTDPPVPLPSRP